MKTRRSGKEAEGMSKTGRGYCMKKENGKRERRKRNAERLEKEEKDNHNMKSKRK